MSKNKALRITLADGTEIDVTPTLEDTLNFETTLRRNKHWGQLADNALKITPFRAWSAAKRLGLIDLSWDEFSAGDKAAINVESVPDEDEDDSLEVPGLGKDTPTTPSTSSASPSPSEPASAPSSGSKSRATTTD